MGEEKEWEGWLFLLHAPRVEKIFVSYCHGSKGNENYYKWREQDPNEAPCDCREIR